MSPAPRKKASKTTRKNAKTAKAPKRARKTAARPKAAKPAPMSASGHAHCAAADPFGDACQNLPRRPSKYCVIHSYLER